MTNIRYLWDGKCDCKDARDDDARLSNKNLQIVAKPIWYVVMGWLVWLRGRSGWRCMHLSNKNLYVDYEENMIRARGMACMMARTLRMTMHAMTTHTFVKRKFVNYDEKIRCLWDGLAMTIRMTKRAFVSRKLVNYDENMIRVGWHAWLQGRSLSLCLYLGAFGRYRHSSDSNL